MRWLYLYAAIALEIAGSSALKFSRGFERLEFGLVALACYGGSIFLFSRAIKFLPIGVAYALWAGIGTVAVAIIGFLWFKEPVTWLRLMFVALIIIGAVGLNLVTEKGA